ncbi:MAG: neutral zinc metallopeptidase [Thermomicrobiales bacterium]|nr:neutral zinc metallopeptidase [Thermomicrobiales bacterium]MCO5223269.1 neutral zinc metallopeptidase [Thermomicrobiales bacterium]
MRHRFLAILAVGIMVLGMVVPVRAQTTATDATTLQYQAQAADAARTILALAGARDFNTMYDLMHPDSQAIAPRAAVVGLFDAAYTQAQAGVPQIIAVEVLDYIWPVTGQTYRPAAQVTFVQPIVDQNGQQTYVQDAIYLAPDSSGTWGWFFGNSAEMVQNAIDTYGSSNAAPQGDSTVLDTPLTQGDFLVNTVNDLDAFWRDVINYTEYSYQSPGVVIVAEGDTVQSACGPASTGFWGFYCPVDQKMYLDEKLLDDLRDQGYYFAAAFVIAHEWAHHVQSGIGLTRTTAPTQWNEVHSIELELMADCMAGVWARDAEGRGVIDPGDIEQAATFAIQMLGDPSYIGEYDEQAHGTGEQRVSALMGGYNDGFLACNLLI